MFLFFFLLLRINPIRIIFPDINDYTLCHSIIIIIIATIIVPRTHVRYFTTRTLNPTPTAHAIIMVHRRPPHALDLTMLLDFGVFTLFWIANNSKTPGGKITRSRSRRRKRKRRKETIALCIRAETYFGTFPADGGRPKRKLTFKIKIIITFIYFAVSVDVYKIELNLLLLHYFVLH